VSASQAKATRQQIRKAFGPEAVAVIADLHANLADLRQGTSAFEVAHLQRLTALEAERARLKSFRARLVWLFRG
jgi:hypothetical protein